jgi:predicted transposase YdaD
LIYIGSNVSNIKAEQLRETVSEALKEGGVIMGTAFQELFDRGKEIGVKEGKEVGVKEGDEKAMWRFALSCIKEGINIETIARITGLPIERIELLKNVIQS